MTKKGFTTYVRKEADYIIDLQTDERTDIFYVYVDYVDISTGEVLFTKNYLSVC